MIFSSVEGPQELSCGSGHGGARHSGWWRAVVRAMERQHRYDVGDHVAAGEEFLTAARQLSTADMVRASHAQR